MWEGPCCGSRGGESKGQEESQVLPPLGCVTSGSFLPFLGLSVSMCKMDMVLSLEVMGG